MPEARASTTRAPAPPSPGADSAPSWLEALNPQQRAAVTSVDGPLLVIAGAGTGKTRALITRIAHLVRGHDVHPTEILGITFTRKAAAEMRDRLAAMLDRERAEAVTLGTFHALGVKLLREYGGMLGLESKFGIVDETEAESRARSVLKGLGMGLDGEDERPRDVAERISLAKTHFTNSLAHGVLEEGREAEGLIRAYRSGEQGVWQRFAAELEAPSVERFTEQFAAYQEALVGDNVIDYQDLISLPLLLFLERPEVLRMQHDRWRYLLVDEYQDTDFTQEYLLRLLAGPERNLCVVGDDDQAIYSWRGAKVENIRTFPERWAPCEVVKLEQNYRSTRTIIDTAHEVLASRPEVDRHEKRLWTDNPEGDPIRVWTCSTQEAEAIAVAEDIRHALAEGWIDSLDDVLVLFRLNALARPLEDALRREQLPYRIVSGTALHERKEVRDLLSYLRVIDNPRDFASFERAATTPSRGIGPVSLDHLFGYARTMGLMPHQAAARAGAIDKIRAPQARALLDFAGLLDGVRRAASEQDVAAAVRRVLEETGFRHDLIEELAEREAEGDDYAARSVMRRLHALDDFTLYVEEFARGEAGAPRTDGSITALLDELATLSPGPDAMSEEAWLEDAREGALGAVTLMSVHAAKGLEAPRVYVVGLEEEIFPVWSEREEEDRGGVLDGPVVDEEMAEEARLFYVAVTRAERHLILSASRTRELYRGDPRPMMRSRFVEAVPSTRFVHNEQR